MKKIILKFITALLLITLVSCSDPLDKKYNENSLADDLQEIVARDKVNKTDMENLSVYIIRAKIMGETLDGKTYKELFEEANKYAAE